MNDLQTLYDILQAKTPQYEAGKYHVAYLYSREQHEKVLKVLNKAVLSKSNDNPRKKKNKRLKRNI